MSDKPGQPKVIVADAVWNRIEQDAATDQVHVLIGRSVDSLTPLVHLSLPQSTYEAVIRSDEVRMSVARKVFQLRALASEILSVLASASSKQP